MALVFGMIANPGLERTADAEESAPRLALARIVLPVLALLLAAGFVRYFPAEFYAEKARSALRDERHVAAMLWANRALALDQRNPDTWFYLGESRVRRAERSASPAARASFERASIPPFEHALALAPNDETFMIALGRVYDSLGRYPEAEWMFGRALAWDPRSQVAQRSYAAHLAFWRGARLRTVPQPKLDLPDQSAPIEAKPTLAPSPTP
jgi:Flp pilus assembly protein TadD